MGNKFTKEEIAEFNEIKYEMCDLILRISPSMKTDANGWGSFRQRMALAMGKRRFKNDDAMLKALRKLSPNDDESLKKIMHIWRDMQF